MDWSSSGVMGRRTPPAMRRGLASLGEWSPPRKTRMGVEKGSDLFDGALAGGVDELGKAVSGGCEVFDRGEKAGGFFKVGGVAGGRAGDEVFAGVGVDHELLRS